LKQRGDAVIAQAEAKLNAVLDDKLTKLKELADSQRSQFSSQLDALAKNAINDLDQVLEKNIVEADSKLDDQQGNFLGLLTKSITELSQVLLAVAAAATLFVAVVQICLGYFRGPGRRFSGRQVAVTAGITASALVALCLVVVAIRVGVERVRGDDYVDAYNHKDFKTARIFASTLAFMYPANPQYSVYKEKSAALRDLIERPTLMVRPESLSRYADRLKYASDGQFELTNARDADLEALRALIMWRRSDTRLGEYYSAALAFNALREAPRLPDNQKFVLRDAAKYYLNAYLLRPLSDNDLEILGLNRTEAEKALGTSGYSLPTLGELKQLAAENKVDNWLMDYQQLHLQIIPKYVKLIILHSSGPRTPKAQLGALQAQQIAIADEIIALWEAFAVTHVGTTDSRRAKQALAGFTAIYARAAAYRRALPVIDHSTDLKTIPVGDLYSVHRIPSPLTVNSPAELVGQPCVGGPFHMGILKNIPPRDPQSRGILDRWSSQGAQSSSQQAQLLNAKSKENFDEDRLFAFEYFVYKSSMTSGTLVSGCLADPITWRLLVDISHLPAPKFIEDAPAGPRHFLFRRSPQKATGAIKSSAFFTPDWKLRSGELQSARSQAIFEAASLGLFTCSSSVTTFDACSGDTRKTVANLLLSEFSDREFLPISTIKLVNMSLGVRIFPVLD
jgi:hypothetical protein